MSYAKTATISGVAGIAITLISSAARNTYNGLLGSSGYGYPTAWLYRLVIAPQYFPWRANYLNLIIDIIFWAIIAAIVIMITEYLHKPPQKARRANRKMRSRA
jgi:hypothetical protein